MEPKGLLVHRRDSSADKNPPQNDRLCNSRADPTTKLAAPVPGAFCRLPNGAEQRHSKRSKMNEIQLTSRETTSATSIQQAIDSLGPDGGRVILPEIIL